MRDGDAKFQRALSIGNMGEHVVVDWLQARGCGVIPSYEFNGKDGAKAPRLMFSGSGLVIPDLDVCRDGVRSWIEIKTYHGAALNRNHNCMVHGIPERLYRDYLAVEAKSGTMAWIAILELDTCDLRLARLSTLEMWPCQCGPCKSENGRCWSDIKRGVYWRRDSMKMVYTFAPAELDHIRKAKGEAA